MVFRYAICTKIDNEEIELNICIAPNCEQKRFIKNDNIKLHCSEHLMLLRPIYKKYKFLQKNIYLEL